MKGFRCVLGQSRSYYCVDLVDYINTCDCINYSIILVI